MKARRSFVFNEESNVLIEKKSDDGENISS